MLQLEIKKKLNRVIESGNLKHWMKWEDTLVAIVFGFAAYMPFDILLGPILEAATPLKDSKAFPSGIKDSDIKLVELWPQLKDLKKHFHPLIEIRPGKSDELDAFWSFKNFSLIIEAKKFGVQFDPKQLYKYINAYKNISGPLWVLAVGKGLVAVRSLTGLKVGKDVNVLYIDWESILRITKQLSDNQLMEEHKRRCLKDISKSLEGRGLKPFDGFFCSEKALRLQSNENIQKAVREGWFPHILWAILPEPLSGMKMQFKQWLIRPL
ncbi:MAG: hypothetical protein JRD68_08905 [Deltaproteobacteria bacterium]|nr:hypothetical protein [Deltaproteobacteria bacterium]